MTYIAIQVFCIGLFICAASLFGTIIAQVNEIVSQLTTRKKDLENILSSYVYLTPRYLSITWYLKQAMFYVSLYNIFLEIIFADWTRKQCFLLESGRDSNLQ